MQCLTLDQSDFRRLLGSLYDRFLQRAEAEYASPQESPARDIVLSATLGAATRSDGDERKGRLGSFEQNASGDELEKREDVGKKKKKKKKESDEGKGEKKKKKKPKSDKIVSKKAIDTFESSSDLPIGTSSSVDAERLLKAIRTSGSTVMKTFQKMEPTSEGYVAFSTFTAVVREADSIFDHKIHIWP